MQALAGKVAIVTGASSGIGRASAKLFAQEAASVVVSARRKAELTVLVAQIEDAGGRAIGVAGDVRDEALAKELVDTAVGRFGGLDIALTMPVRWEKWRRSWKYESVLELRLHRSRNRLTRQPTCQDREIFDGFWCLLVGPRWIHLDLRWH
jgi:hypothetical protein